MDLTIVIIALVIGLGYFLNKTGKEPRKTTQQNNTISKYEKPVAYDNYFSNNYEKIRQFERTIADNLDNQSLDFEHSGIVFPEIYQDERILPKFGNDSIKQVEITTTPLSEENFSNVSPITSKYSDFYKDDPSRQELFDQLPKPFIHGNQFSPSLNGNQSKQSLRETMSTEDAKFSKREVKSFNEPEKITYNILENLEFMADRAKSTVSNIMNGVKLMQPIIEAPNTTGDPNAKWEGKNPAFRGYASSVDELRSVNNPKQDFSTDFKSVGSFLAQKPTLEQNDTRRIKQKAFQVDFDNKIAKFNVPQYTMRPSNEMVYDTARSVLGETNYSGNIFNPKSMTYHESQHKDASNLRGDETDYQGPSFNHLTKPTIQNRTTPKTTIKETTQTDYTGNCYRSLESGYKLKKLLNHQTLRSTLNDDDRAGGASSNTKKFMAQDSNYNAEINGLKSIIEKSYRPPVPQGQALPANQDQTDYENFRSVRGVIGNTMYLTSANGNQKIHDKICKKLINKTNKIREIDYSDRMEPFKGRNDIVDNPYGHLEKSY